MPQAIEAPANLTEVEALREALARLGNCVFLAAETNPNVIDAVRDAYARAAELGL